MSETVDSGLLAPPSGDVIAALCRSVSVVRTHIEREVLQPRQLTWTTFDVLHMVRKHPRIRLHELATVTGTPKGTVVSAVHVLEVRRLVVRHTPRDLRQVELQATGEGQRLVSDMITKVADIEGRLMPDPQLRRTVAAIARRFHHPPALPARAMELS